MAKKQKVYWPSWRYGPSGEAKIFQKPEDVPAGWQDTPQPATPQEKAEAPKGEEHEGYTRKFLEDVVRQSGGRVYARDTAATLFRRAQKTGLLDPVEAGAEEEADDEEEIDEIADEEADNEEESDEEDEFADFVR